LEEIKEILNRPSHNALDVIRMHMQRLREQIDIQQQLCRRLEDIAELLEQRGHIPTQQLIYVLEGIRMSEKYPFTPDQMEKIKKQGELLGPNKIREVEQEWPQLIAAVHAEMEKGTSPESPEVQALARRWKELVEMFTGGDPEIAGTLQKRYNEEPGYAEQFGLDNGTFEYIGEAMIHL
jgi:MerR family transcriptional regulator, thiopeptide resistance regulator